MVAIAYYLIDIQSLAMSKLEDYQIVKCIGKHHFASELTLSQTLI